MVRSGSIIPKTGSMTGPTISISQMICSNHGAFSPVIRWNGPNYCCSLTAWRQRIGICPPHRICLIQRWQKAGTRNMAVWFMAMRQTGNLPMRINISGFRQKRLPPHGVCGSAQMTPPIKMPIIDYGAMPGTI